MATIYEYYTTGESAAFGIPAYVPATDRIGQTFTPQITHTIEQVALDLYRIGSPGILNVYIYGVDESGFPTGDALCSGITDGDTLTTNTAGITRTITLGVGSELSSDTKYAIILMAPNAELGVDYVNWKVDHIGANYTRGDTIQRPNMSGDDEWQTRTGADFMFTEYGFDVGAELPGAPTLVSPSPTGVTNITLDETPLEWAAGDPAGDTYEVYFRESGDDWELVGVAQAGIEWAIEFGTLAYETIYEWRIDATNVHGTTTGNTWSFTTISFDRILISYDLLPGGRGAGYGPYDDPPGIEGEDWSWTGGNAMLAVRRLVVAVDNKIWYEVV